MEIKKFRALVRRAGRTGMRDFPWRRTKDPYRILVSEIMLQQTQVSRVVQKYNQFIASFPTFQRLADTPLSEVIRAWQGLGYNRRALALHKLARRIAGGEYQGRLPKTAAELTALPGVGPATAGALRAYAWNMPSVFIETNIRRVFLRHFFRGRRTVSDDEILALVSKTLDRKNPRIWYTALTDYGAELGRLPQNPNRRSNAYVLQSRFTGSRRELRGQILKLLSRRSLTLAEMRKALSKPISRIESATNALYREGFLSKRGNHFLLGL